MKRKGWILFCCLFCSYFCCCAQGGRLDHLLKSGEVRHAELGIAVKSVKEGKVLLEYRSDKSLQPASVCKLLASAFALMEKGGDFHYTTTVFTTGSQTGKVLDGDVVISAQGDPCLDSRYFPESVFLDRILDKVKQSGITCIQGRIRIERTEETVLPGTWLWEDVSNYYAAAYRSFNYKDNTYRLGFKTGPAGEEAELLSVEPEQPGIHFVSKVKASTENVDNAWIYGGPYSDRMYVLGTLPQNRRLIRIKGAMNRPDLCFRNELEEKLKEKGIRVEKKVLPEKERKVMLTIISPSLKEIVRETNKRSINLFAEALGKLVDENDYPQRCKELLQENSISSSGVQLKDACGLSVGNAVPAAVFTDLLVWAHRKLGEDFITSLPVAGTDAGLNAYCSAFPALKNRLKAKTGSYTGVRCLSGYLTTYQGKELAFTILINHFDGPPARLQRKVGEFLQSLLEL